MSKPIIGILEWPYADKDNENIYEIPTNVVRKVIENGGRPIGIFPSQLIDFYNTKGSDILEMTQIEKEDLIENLTICDAIIKPGATRIYNYEKFIYKWILENNVPYLGICAGMQLMNIYDKDGVTNPLCINHYGDNNSLMHLVDLKLGSRIYDIYHDSRVLVNSRHTRTIESSDTSFIAGRAQDGVIEVLERPDMRFNIGVQWHPEDLDDVTSKVLFKEFINEAKRK